MFSMADSKKIGKWHRPGAEVPPEWHDALVQLALDINRGQKGMLRYVWAVAIDLVLSLKQDEVRRRVRDLQNLDLDDFPALVNRHSPSTELGKRMLEAAEKKVAHKRRKRGA